jgi:hypothetical protein
MAAKSKYARRRCGRPHINCPVCGDTMRVYASRPVSSGTRELFFKCLNTDCDASYRSVLQHINCIIDSLLPPEDPRRLSADADMPKLRRRDPAGPDPRQLSLPELPGAG